jgi:hypothetical protein
MVSGFRVDKVVDTVDAGEGVKSIQLLSALFDQSVHIR